MNYNTTDTLCVERTRHVPPLTSDTCDWKNVATVEDGPRASPHFWIRRCVLLLLLFRRAPLETAIVVGIAASFLERQRIRVFRTLKYRRQKRPRRHTDNFDGVSRRVNRHRPDLSAVPTHRQTGLFPAPHSVWNPNCFVAAAQHFGVKNETTTTRRAADGGQKTSSSSSGEGEEEGGPDV